MTGALGRAGSEDPPFGGRRPHEPPRPRGSRRLGTLALAVTVAALLALVGCDDGDGGEPSASTAASGAVTVWFADQDGVLRTERRPAAAGAEALDAALAALEEGPDDPALLPALPPGTRILGAGVADDVATVDLSAEFESAYPAGGAAAELAVIGPLVRTASDASGAARVRLLVEGRAPAPVGTQFDLSQPLAPGDLPAP